MATEVGSPSEEVREAKVLAAIPAFNEEVAIGSVVLRTRPYVDEVLVVDDGSDDLTAEVARLAKGYVLRNPSNEGKGVAIQIALEYARAKGFDAMVLLDGDGQHDPTQIPEVLQPILRGEADITVGVRRRATSRMPLYRRLGQRLLDFVTAAGGGGALTDSQCGFRALSRRAINVLDLDERDFSIESEMLIEAKAKDLLIAEVPVRARYDVDGSTRRPLSHGFGVVERVLSIIAVRHPLLFFGIIGTTLFVVGVLLGLVALNTYRYNPELATGYSFLVVIFLITGGLSVFAAVMLNVLPQAVARYLRGREQ